MRKIDNKKIVQEVTAGAHSETFLKNIGSGSPWRMKEREMALIMDTSQVHFEPTSPMIR
jgi:hypothetical protein